MAVIVLCTRGIVGWSYISQLSPAIRVICLESKLPFEKKPFLVVGLESVEPGIW